jgi:RNA polymerase sigma-70 factor, ECF subfamily
LKSLCRDLTDAKIYIAEFGFLGKGTFFFEVQLAEIPSIVYRFLLYYTGSREEAEDLTQETFLKVVSNLAKFDARSELKTWIITIARNLALDHLCKRNRAVKLAKLLGRHPVEFPELPEDLVYKNERSRALHQTIQTLKDEYRTVVILRGMQELTPAETAAVLAGTKTKSIWSITAP